MERQRARTLLKTHYDKSVESIDDCQAHAKPIGSGLGERLQFVAAPSKASRDVEERNSKWPSECLQSNISLNELHIQPREF